MAKRARVLIAALFVALLALLAWTSLRKTGSEPVFEGKPLSEWLLQLKDSNSDVERIKAAEAVRHIGTNAIPTLLQMLREEESPFETKYLAWHRGWYNPFVIHLKGLGGPADIFERAEAGFRELGPSAAAAVPELSRMLDREPSLDGTSYVPSILGNIGPGAKAAVPALLRAALSTNTLEHFYELDALGQIHADPDSVVPVLIGIISNAPKDRIYAVRALGQFRGEAKSAVPALVALLNDPNLQGNSSRKGLITDRFRVESALQKIDPETYARVVTNTDPASTR
jgi:HEAT repeat protein